MARKLALLLVFSCLAIVGGLQLGTPAPASAATINVTASCGSASYVGGRLRQEFNVTINGPALVSDQVFSTSGWATNVGTFHYMSTSPAPHVTPYPFSGTMYAAFADDVFSPTTPPTNPPGGSTVQYTLGAYVIDPSEPINTPAYFVHIGSVVVDCFVPPNGVPLAADDFLMTATSGINKTENLEDHFDGGAAPFTLSIQTPPTNGTATIGTGSTSVTYRTNKGTAGTDSFVYKVTDIEGTTETGTVTVNYAAPAPLVVTPRTLNVAHGGNGTLTLGATGGIGTKTISLVTPSPSAKGTFSLTGTTFSYQAGAGQFGTDTITYRAIDQTDPSQNVTNTITVTIAPPPVVASDFMLVSQVPYEGSGTGTVANLTTGGQPPLSYGIATQPTKGTVTVNPATGDFTYEANDGATGADSFVYRASDASSTPLTDTGTISLTIAPAPLTGVDSSLTVVAGSTASVDVSTLIDGGTAPFIYSASDPPKGGVDIVGSVYTYTADINERGADSFTYTVLDAGAGVNSQTVTKTINVTIIDPPIVIAPPSVTSVTAGQSTTIDLSGNATGGTGNLTYTIDSQGTKGTSTLAGKSLTYNANAADRGSDTVKILVTDESPTPQTQTMSVPILVTAPTLVVSGTTASVEAGQSVQVDVSSLIAGGTGPFAVSLDDDGTKGTATVSDQVVTYLANAADRGADTVVFRITDVSNPVQSVTAEIAITITAPELELANPDQSITAGQPLIVDLSSLVSGGTPDFTFSLISGPANGPFLLTGSSFTFTPNAGYRGGDSFEYQVVDESDPVQTKTAEISILVTAPQLVVGDTSNTVTAGQATAVDLTSLISGGTGPFTLTVESDGAKGTTTVSGLSLIYTANAADRGDDTVVFRITDVSDPVQSVTAELAILITAPEMSLSSPSQSVTAGQTLTLDLATLVSGGTPNFAYSLTANPTEGAFDLSASTFTYTPDADYRGGDSFTFSVTDGSDPIQTKSTTISILVTAPVLVVAPDSGSVLAGEPISFELSTLVSGGTADFSYAIEADGTKGTSSLAGTTLTYTANGADRGADTVTFRVTDESDPVQSVVGTLSILITAPDLIVSDTSAVLTAGESIGIDLSGLVSGGTPGFSYKVVNGGGKGSSSISGSTLTYTANAGDRGANTVEVEVTDSSDPQQSEVISVAIAIDAPALNGGGTSIEVGAGQSGSVNLAALISGGTGPFSFAIETAPSFGSASISGSTATYTPNNAFEGLDSFTVRVTDSSSPQQSTLISISVSVVAPQVSDQTVAVTGDPRFPITGSAAIVGFDGLTYSLLSGPAIGSVTVSANGAFTYTIGSTVATGTSFTVLATDIYGNTAVVTVVLTFDVDETVSTKGTVSRGNSGGSGGGGSASDPRSPSQPQPTPVDSGEDDDDGGDSSDCARCG
jgi:hypothetical protein